MSPVLNHLRPVLSVSQQVSALRNCCSTAPLLAVVQSAQAAWIRLEGDLKGDYLAGVQKRDSDKILACHEFEIG